MTELPPDNHFPFQLPERGQWPWDQAAPSSAPRCTAKKSFAQNQSATPCLGKQHVEPHWGRIDDAAFATWSLRRESSQLRWPRYGFAPTHGGGRH